MDYLKTLIPLITFIAGYFLSRLHDFIARWKQIRNIRSMLFKEIGENYHQLNFSLTKNIKEIDNKTVAVLADMADALSVIVYENYISKIDILGKDQLGKIYDCY